MDRRQFLTRSLVAGVSTTQLLPSRVFAEAESSTQPIQYRLERQTPARRFNGKESYCHPRAGIVPGTGKGGLPRFVCTLMTIDLTGSDVFKAMFDLSTDDLGRTWNGPSVIPELSYRMQAINGQERPVACSDFWPTWHKHTKKLLGTGHTVAYTTDWKVKDDRPRDTAYAVYDAASGQWSPWEKMSMGDDPRFTFAGAGCTQRFDLSDGTILLPIYYRTKLDNPNKRVTVTHCSFDGKTLKYLDRGSDVFVDDGTRGVGEPSLTRFNDTYYMTIRHPLRAYVTRSSDGLHFEPVRPWTFDDGTELGSYETQAHWVTHSDGLFLVYTRRGLNNDYVFRHRAPLVMAQVDPERMCVLRKTERELVPNRGARLGNFGVTDVSPTETWVTVAEWMQPKGVEKHGSDGTVWMSRIHWERPNRYF